MASCPPAAAGAIIVLNLTPFMLLTLCLFGCSFAFSSFGVVVLPFYVGAGSGTSVA